MYLNVIIIIIEFDPYTILFTSKRKGLCYEDFFVLN